MKRGLRFALALTLLVSSGLAGSASTRLAQAPPPDALAAGFANPPSSARPRVWWHWMNGNVTQEGIRKDLEWMARIGIGGLQNFDAALSTPQVVPQRLAYMTPEWNQAFKSAVVLADELGLELAIAASPGWSETGGPWVEPQDGMKKLVWSETELEGGRRFSGRLPSPPTNAGAFQSLGKAPGIADFLSVGPKKPLPAHYADVAVIAYQSGSSGEVPAPHVRSSDGRTLDAALLQDADYESGVEVSTGTAENPGFLSIDYTQPRTIRSVVVRAASGTTLEPNLLPRFEASDDGKTWRNIVAVPLGFVPTTVSFAPVSARHFRLLLATRGGVTSRGASFGGAAGAIRPSAAQSARPATTMKLAELRLSGDARVNRFEAKAGFSVAPDYYSLDADVGPDIVGVVPGSTIDLTDRVAADGQLDWTPPRGRWTVIRFGYSLTGAWNHPATAEATGLEVDKYDGAAVRRYMSTYLRMFSGITGPELMGKRGLRAIVTDSIETGASNWTGNMIAQFQRLRGYDPRPWMPALAGVIVGSRSQSDAFLYDFRRTLADLIASEHYAQVAATAREYGLTVYGEALELGRPVIGDDMEMRRYADVPMAACWTYPLDAGVHPSFLADMKGAASVAHLYGQNLVAAESLTSGYSPWAYAPADLRRVIDLEFSQGINRPVIHTSVHQPVDDKVPGLSLSFFGQYFTRHETWAEMARPWVDYIARNSFMLQQGRNVADVAYFYGEEAPLTSLYRDDAVADAPVRYAYDFVNADVVLNRLSVDGNDLVAASGARYAVLYLGGSTQRMTLPVLRKLAALAEAGATIVGRAPVSSPGMKDQAGEFTTLVRRLWSGADVTSVGMGRVIDTDDVEGALRRLGVAPDFSFTSPQNDSQILFVHRRLPDGDVYFVNNRKARTERADTRFRVIGKRPEVWRADTGATEPVSYRIENGQTVIPLELLPEESYFVVFRAPASASAATVDSIAWKKVAEIDGDWDASFQPGRGAPPSARLEKLQSLSAHTDPGIRYFSGIARYTKTFDLPRESKPGAPLMLDLGAVGDVAEVRINGKLIGTLWKAPYRIDIGVAVRRRRNEIDIRVANLWANRLIGDAQPGAASVAFSTVPTYRPDAPLRPSGLIGPVSLIAPAAESPSATVH
jgi:hypothetical protein